MAGLPASSACVRVVPPFGERSQNRVLSQNIVGVGAAEEAAVVLNQAVGRVDRHDRSVRHPRGVRRLHGFCLPRPMGALRHRFMHAGRSVMAAAVAGDGARNHRWPAFIPPIFRKSSAS